VVWDGVARQVPPVGGLLGVVGTTGGVAGFVHGVLVTGVVPVAVPPVEAGSVGVGVVAVVVVAVVVVPAGEPVLGTVQWVGSMVCTV
jgi:hypothetical protein